MVLGQGEKNENKTKVLSVQLGKTLSFVKFGSGLGWVVKLLILVH